MQTYDNWRFKRDEVMSLYLSGKPLGEICGRTGVPLCRLKRELAYAVQRNPQLLERHLRASFPSQRRKMRFPGATLVIEPREKTASVNEY